MSSYSGNAEAGSAVVGLSTCLAQVRKVQVRRPHGHALLAPHLRHLARWNLSVWALKATWGTLAQDTATHLRHNASRQLAGQIRDLTFSRVNSI